MDAFEILVIILSITLAIFLVIAIVVGLLLVKLLKRIDVIAEHAEHIVTNIDAAAERFKQAAVPAALVSFATKIIKQYKG